MQRTPNYNYKIRRTTKGNKTGDSFALTVPRVIANKFDGVQFFLTITNNSIIFESGCALL